MITNRQQSLIFGSFNAERFWRETQYATLPSFNDEQANRIVNTMDEMQFVFGNGARASIATLFPMNPLHLMYLSELGFELVNIGLIGSVIQESDLGKQQSITTILGHSTEGQQLLGKLGDQRIRLDPYAIVPGHSSLSSELDLTSYFPDEKVVRWVNSKVYSTKISHSLDIGSGGIVVDSIEILKQKAEIMLKDSPILIKDPLGVSGNGNILIKKDATLRSIVKHLELQEASGKIVSFIIEPFLAKKIDFSCQALIRQNGEFDILSYHVMHNEKFRFSGIQYADEELIGKIESLGYLDYIRLAVKDLVKNGYFGPVCFDSMILDSGELIPIVEINARKSMGLINHALSKYLLNVSKKLKSKMMTLNFTVEYRLSFEFLYTNLKKTGLLYLNGMKNGILPLSANTVDVNARTLPLGPFKGRFYYQIIYEKIEDCEELQLKIYMFFDKLCLRNH